MYVPYSQQQPLRLLPDYGECDGSEDQPSYCAAVPRGKDARRALRPSMMSEDQLDFYRVVDRAFLFARPNHHSGAIVPYLNDKGQVEMADRSFRDVGDLAYLVILTYLPKKSAVLIEVESHGESKAPKIVPIEKVKSALLKVYLGLKKDRLLGRFRTSKQDLSMTNVKTALIKLGYTNPDLRPHLRPILDYITEPSRVAKSLSDVNVEDGKMRRILNVAEGEDISDKYSPSEATKKLINAVGRDEAASMINWIANLSKSKFFDDMQRYLKTS